MRKTLLLVDRVASSEVPVLLIGERQGKTNWQRGCRASAKAKRTGKGGAGRGRKPEGEALRGHTWGRGDGRGEGGGRLCCAAALGTGHARTRSTGAATVAGGSPRERQPELTERGERSGRWRPRPEPEPSEQLPSCLGGGGRLDPAHRSAAAGTSIEVRLEHMFQEPGPPLSCRRLGVALRVEQQDELIARSRRRRGGTGIGGRVRDYFSAEP
jgi:hypothetical protein